MSCSAFDLKLDKRAGPIATSLRINKANLWTEKESTIAKIQSLCSKADVNVRFC